MEITSATLEAKLRGALDISHVEVKDVSESCGCGLKFEVVVVSPDFEGKGLLARHRLVNGCLAEEIKQIHAFGQKTYTPEQWSSRKNRVADTLN